MMSYQSDIRSNLKNTNQMGLIKKDEVIKRDGRREKVSFDKISQRIEGICEKLNLERINTTDIAKETMQGLYDGITTEELDIFAANKCAEKILKDTQYNTLSAGICISNLQKTTPTDFLVVTEKLYNNKDKNGEKNQLVTDEYYKFVKDNIERLNESIDYSRDYYFDFFGIKTLERSYLIRIKEHTTNKKIDHTEKKYNKNEETDLREKYGRVIERPQHMIMRVAASIHIDNIDDCIETYDLFSKMYFTHASPTLYNAGSPTPQLSSCFLINPGDSINSIFDCIKDAAFISKMAGGIGINLSNIRAKGSLIRGTNGESDGVIPLCKVLNEQARYVNQGGRRKGAFAVYLEAWHADVYEMCELRKQQGVEELRARDLFLALWVPDLFMKRLINKDYWSLMCPDECPGLTTTYGDEFEELYLKYESEGKYKKRVKAENMLFHIMECQIESGMPYMMFKDNINRQTNQKNLGVIQCSNLCAEICEYTSPDEIAVCNLASLCLPKFIKTDDNGNKFYDYNKLKSISKVVTRNLNKVIDVNYYPVDKAKYSNIKHRPIGLGVQGLCDVYSVLNIPFDSEEARVINKKIFETIYFGCLEASMELAKKDGPYDSFKGSPFSEGQLQWHLWGLDKKDLLMEWDWDKLIKDIKQFGTRNSLLTAVMPTQSTSQIMGCTECIEPRTTNMYTRSTLAGEFIVVNQHLVEKLISLNLWTKEVREEFLYDNGSIQNISEIPDYIKKVYETAFEMKTKPIVQQSVERGPFIDQSQSLNLFSDRPDFKMLSSSHIYSWRNKLKTGMYYLKSQPAVNPLNFGLDHNSILRIREKRGENINKNDINNEDAEIDANISDDEVNVRAKLESCSSCC